MKGFYFRKRSPDNDFSLVEQGRMVADSLHIRQNVRGKQDRCCAADFAKNIQDFFSTHRVKGAGWLVTNQQLGPGE